MCYILIKGWHDLVKPVQNWPNSIFYTICCHIFKFYENFYENLKNNSPNCENDFISILNSLADLHSFKIEFQPEDEIASNQKILIDKTEAEYKKINKHYESNRNEDNFTLIIITEILEFIDDEKLGDVINLIKTKGEVTSIAYCYVAI